jgi:hypothetical protein
MTIREHLAAQPEQAGFATSPQWSRDQSISVPLMSGRLGERLTQLQHGYGNQYVQRLVARLRDPAENAPSGVERVIQRYLGFEFETGVPVRDANGKELPYNQCVYSRPEKDWEIKADSSNLEFVTAKIGDYQKNQTTMESLVTCARKLQGELNTNGTTTIMDYKVGPYDGRIASNPQVTFGVPLENIVALLTRGSSEKISTYLPTAGAVTITKSQLDVDHDYEDATTLAALFRQQILQGEGQLAETERRDVDRVVGLAALVFHHLNDLLANGGGGVLEYSKAIFTIMHRTDFHSMYRSISDQRWREKFTPDRIADIWWTSGNVNATARGKLEELDRKYSHRSGFSVRGKNGLETQQGYPLGAWLRSIVNPEDKQGMRGALADAVRWDNHDKTMREGRGPGAGERKLKDLMSRGSVRMSSESVGMLGMDTDPRFPGRPLAVLEFRELAGASAIDYTKWKVFAAQMQDLYEEVTVPTP